jgi:Flp pilus assembly protein TadG
VLLRGNHRARDWTYRGDPRDCRGMVTVLFAAVILPLIFVMLTLTVELAHFFGIRDELQRVLDREAHDALVRGSTEGEVVYAVQQRMRNVSGMAALTSVRHVRSAARSMIEAQAEYRGAFFQILQEFTGQDRTILPIWLQSQVRIQSAASLVIVDRSVPAGANPCIDTGLRAMTSFADRLAESWAGVAEARIAVGVFPGGTERRPGGVAPIELLARDAQDNVPRCRAAQSTNSFDLSAIRGSVETPPDAYSVAFDLRDIVDQELVQQAREVRTVVLVLRRERYDRGYAQSVFNLLLESVQGLPLPIDMYVVVLDSSQTIDSRPLSIGINGGVYREIGAAESELAGVRLLGVMSQALTGRIVVER